jgi:hypothetical protein
MNCISRNLRTPGIQKLQHDRQWVSELRKMQQYTEIDSNQGGVTENHGAEDM